MGGYDNNEKGGVGGGGGGNLRWTIFPASRK